MFVFNDDRITFPVNRTDLKHSFISDSMDTFDGIHTFSEEDAQLVDSLLDDVSKGALTVNSSHLLLKFQEVNSSHP